MINMLPFLELEIGLPGLKEKDVDNPDKIVIGNFLPTTLVAYHPAYWEENTMIYLNNGQPFLLAMTVEVYEDKIKQYFELINKPVQPQKNGMIHKLK